MFGFTSLTIPKDQRYTKLHVRKPNIETGFFLLNRLISDIIASVEKHKTIHTRFGMNDLFF